MDHTNKPRARLKVHSGADCGGQPTEIAAPLYSTFAHCVALNCMWLLPRLTQIGKKFS